MKTLIFTSIFACTVFGCGSKKTELINPIGTYTGNYRGGTETFDLRADGSFSQTFVESDGAILYTNEGKWTIRNEIISFRPFVTASDDPHKDPSKLNKVDSGIFPFDQNPDRIVLGERTCILKEKKHDQK